MHLRLFLLILIVYILGISQNSAANGWSCNSIFRGDNPSRLFTPGWDRATHDIDRPMFVAAVRRANNASDAEIFVAIDYYISTEKSVTGGLAGLGPTPENSVHDFLVETYQLRSENKLRNYLGNAFQVTINRLARAKEPVLQIPVTNYQIDQLFRIEQFIYFREAFWRLEMRADEIFALLGLEYPSDDAVFRASLKNLEPVFRFQIPIEQP